ncbi:hypothetical protein ACFX2G_034776 [Malus domestica]
MHLGNSRALEAASLVPLNGKLCIVRNNMSISLVDVSNSSDVHGESAEHLWETIAGKGQFKTLVTNLWSSLAGRGRLKSPTFTRSTSTLNRYLSRSSHTFKSRADSTSGESPPRPRLLLRKQP